MGQPVQVAQPDVAHDDVDAAFQHDVPDHEQAAFERAHEQQHGRDKDVQQFDRRRPGFIRKEPPQPGHWVNLSSEMSMAIIRNAADSLAESAALK